MKKSNKEFWLKRIFHSTWFFVVVLILLVAFSVSLINEMMRKLEIQREINELEQQVKDLETRNTELGSLIDYFQTEEFITREARAKLGFKNAGETVVAVPDDGVMASDNQAQGRGNVGLANWQIWWNYFFNNTN